MVASPTDHGADIVIVVATVIMLILLCLAIRIHVRSNFSGPWLVDDTVFALATVRNPGSVLLGIELAMT